LVLPQQQWVPDCCLKALLHPHCLMHLLVGWIHLHPQQHRHCVVLAAQAHAAVDVGRA
jgi:hypothetical protein